MRNESSYVLIRRKNLTRVTRNAGLTYIFMFAVDYIKFTLNYSSILVYREQRRQKKAKADRIKKTVVKTAARMRVKMQQHI